jgi:4-amino-4-deoxy-L-arabinose transferase-like glycosyltransferase
VSPFGEVLRQRAELLIVLYSLLLALVGIAGRDLSSHDDTRVAGIARGMALSGDWAVPELNGRPFLEYPPLGYVPCALAIRPFRNPPDFAALLPTAILSAATIFLTMRIGRILGGRSVGLAAGGFLATLSGFRYIHAACLVDPPLLFLVTLSLYGFVAGATAQQRSFARFALFYAGAGAAFLAKGLVGVAIPVAVAGAWVLLRRDFGLLRRMRPLAGSALLVAPVAVWALLAWRAAGAQPVREVISQSLFRFASSDAAHSKAFYHYVVPTLGFSVPALLVILPCTFMAWVAPRRKDLRPGAPALFPTVWFAVTFIGLSAASAKRFIYLGPLSPAVALIAAAFAVRLAAVFPRIRRMAIPSLAVYAVLFTGVHLAVLAQGKNARSLRSTFETVRREMGGTEVILFARKESIPGAAVFYLGRECPQVREVDDLRRAISDGAKTWLIVDYWNKLDGPFRGETPPPGLILIHETVHSGRFVSQVYRRPAAVTAGPR